MNDTMNIQEVFPHISPTHRIHPLKKEHPDSQKRGFERDLEEEKDGEKGEKQGAPILQMAKLSDEKEKREGGKFKEGSADPGADIKKRNGQPTVGTRVDIRV